MAPWGEKGILKGHGRPSSWRTRERGAERAPSARLSAGGRKPRRAGAWESEPPGPKEETMRCFVCWVPLTAELCFFGSLNPPSPPKKKEAVLSSFGSFDLAFKTTKRGSTNSNASLYQKNNPNKKGTNSRRVDPGAESVFAESEAVRSA